MRIPVGEVTLWTGRKSLRPIIPRALLSAGFAAAGYFYAGMPLQFVIDATINILPWTESGVVTTWNLLRAAAFLPLMIDGVSALRSLTTRYELTSERLVYSRGLLVRQQDQIALQRIRDFRIMRPLMARIAGTGVVHIVSRDETLPHLEIGPFTGAGEVEASIRSAVSARQEATGYRELETT
jgi:uncharacterized membrane protein YdbT with pleckstrin-like domain